MSFFFVDPEVYKKHKDDVLRLSNSVQVRIHEHFPADRREGGMSDAQIAETLKLDEQLVREIRVVAERDFYPIDEWQRAIEFKDEACRGYMKQGVSFATRKYRKK